METEDREPCPSCGEPTPVVGRTCSYCRGSLLVDFVLEQPLDDERTAYEIARELKTRWPELVLVEVKRGLEKVGAPVVAGVTRQHGREVATALARHGLFGRSLVRQPLPAATASGFGETLRRRPLPAAAAAMVVVIVIAVLVSRNGEDEPVATPVNPTPAPASTRAVGPAPTPLFSTVALTPREIADRATSSTLTLRCVDSEGSGFFVAPDLVVTNDHVICDGENGIEVELADGRRLRGLPERRDASLDLALVRLDESVGSPVLLGDATQLQRGDQIVVIGNPYGMELTLTQGIVSHNARNVMGVVYLQIDANINPGNSGGPLFDPYGRVAGIVSMTVGESTGLGLALAVNYLYEGADPWLAQPAAASPSAWQQLLDEIEDSDRQQVDDLAAIFDRPGLLAAVRMRGKIAAVVFLREYSVPRAQEFGFDFYRADERLCSVDGEVREWEEIGDAYLRMFDNRTREWLEENNLLSSLWAGVAHVPVDGCSRMTELIGSEVWLDGFEPLPGHRTVVSSGTWR